MKVGTIATWEGTAVSHMTDALVDCAEPEALQALYRATGRAALSKTEQLVGRRDVAEEIVQEVYLKLWQLKLKFPTAKQAYLWIYKACHNAGIDHLRSSAVRRESSQEGRYFESLAHAVDLADQNAKRQLVGRLLHGLDAREAAVLGYTVIEGMTQEEVAALLAVSRKTIVRVVARLETKLRQAKEVGHVT